MDGEDKEMGQAKALLTILTPTYNRAKELQRLYDSLKKQSCRMFEWLIVDDGSEDDTQVKVREWQMEKNLRVQYFRKENGGKHTALNAGIAMIHTPLTFIVDSDDWLPDDAVEIIRKYHEKYREASGLCGYSFLRFYPDGRVNDSFFPENEKVDTYVNVRINGGIAGDKAEVFRTEILKKYPFPVYGDEKFLPEDLVWVQMSGPYRMVHINECIYISEYLEGGLTKSGRRMKMKSPEGMMKRSLAYLEDKEVRLKVKVKMMLLYQVYGKVAEYQDIQLREKLSGKLLYWVCWVPAAVLLRLWMRRYAGISG